METNFFTQLESLMEGMYISLTMTKTKEGKVVVEFSPRAKSNVQDPVAKDIRGLVLTGTAQELDQAFIESIKKPAEKVQGLLQGMAEYEEALEIVEKEKKEAKDKQDALKGETDKIIKSLDALTEKVKKHEEEKEYNDGIKAIEAWTLKHRDNAAFDKSHAKVKAIEKLYADLKAKIPTTKSLFD